MDVRYPLYCLADPRYYESPGRARTSENLFDFGEVVDLPSDWQQVSDGQWTRCSPSTDADLPTQGWKIHVSATVDNAVEILKSVSAYCFQHGIYFKFLPNSLVLRTRNAKYVPRQGSGKFVTVYPRDVPELARTLHGLDREIGGWPGPYILSDLRWRDGPLYVRYGGFAVRTVTDTEGNTVPAIERPDGVLVADRREPCFVLPDWVEVPEFLAETAALRVAADQPQEFPYDVLEVFQFSNGGGVYLAARRHDGHELVLKEGRPHAGLDAADRDAPTRLRTEYRALLDLSGIPGIPAVYDYHHLGGHEFLAMEKVDGIPLRTWATLNYLYLKDGEDSGSTADYVASVDRIVDQIHAAVVAVHDRGYVLNDLSPNNVLVNEDLDISLIDFETATSVTDARKRSLGTPGFTAPAVLRGADVDLYALNAIRLFLYLPLNSLLALCPGKVTELIAWVKPRLDLDDKAAEALTQALVSAETGASGLRPPDLSLRFDTIAGPWAPITDALVASIHGAATPARRDRLFPGDVDQFSHGGGGVAVGAAGVIDTLQTAAAPGLDGYLDWLEHDIRASTDPRWGYFDGKAGMCHVLHKVGRVDAALQFYDVVMAQSSGVGGTKLFNGLAGIGLTSLYFYRRTGVERYLRHALWAAENVAAAIVDSGEFAVAPGRRCCRSSLGRARQERHGELPRWPALRVVGSRVVHAQDFRGRR
jgi:Protein kinase domain